ncbi:MAG: FAD/NAD(P)-binding protein [Acidimicrobiales bacterium]
MLADRTLGRPGEDRGALTPALYRVVGRRDETRDVVTLSITPLSEAIAPMANPRALFRPGQFNMLTAFGVGEAAISVSSAPREDGPLKHTVRDVGPVTHALCRARIGDLVGVRGPFGTNWELGDFGGTAEVTDVAGATSAPGAGDDVVVVAGGIGLAPLRGAVHELVARSEEEGGRVFVVVGAREPAQIVFGEDLEAWSRAGAQVFVTVDVWAPGWTGHVGLVTSLLAEADFDPASVGVLVCGPEIMMRFTARDLVDRGVAPGRIQVSLERNMQCAVAWCGHCQLGRFLLCRDGPVLPYAGAVTHLLSERER